MSFARFLVGDVFDRLAELPPASVDVVVTSPPFLALRSYLPSDHPDKAKEIGSEPTPASFLDTLLDLTAEWRRVLAPHGSICVELGDTYSGSGMGPDEKVYGAAQLNAIGAGRRVPSAGWPLAKSLCGIPTLYAWSLAYGRNLLNPAHECEPWRVRNLIAWTRPNPPVGALGDKVRPATSYVTTACVGDCRYFDNDAERTPHKEDPPSETTAISRKRALNRSAPGNHTEDAVVGIVANPIGAPLLDHWNIPTQPYTGSHYATFPEELPRRLISLMCPPKVCRTCGKPSERVTGDVEYVPSATYRGGSLIANSERVAAGINQWHGPDGAKASVVRTAPTLGWTDCGHDDWRPGRVLDPFAGSGTTLAVAVGMGREAIGIDLDSRNVALAEQRVGLFLEVVDAGTEAYGPSGEVLGEGGPPRT